MIQLFSEEKHHTESVAKKVIQDTNNIQ